MTWKMTPRAAAVMIRRRYLCDVCNHTFEMRHQSEDEPMPDCPNCVALGAAAAAGGGVTYVAPMPAIGTVKGKAIDLAQKMAEEDYGLSDMNDNQRAGDIAYKGPAPMQTAEAEAALRQIMEASAQMGPAAPLPQGPVAPDGTRQLLVDRALQKDNYWQGSQGGSAETTVGQQAAAKAASQAAARDGVDPVGILEQGRLSGNMPFRVNAVSAVPMSDLPQPLQEAQAKRGALP
jgi:hypothetical protein